MFDIPFMEHHAYLESVSKQFKSNINKIYIITECDSSYITESQNILKNTVNQFFLTLIAGIKKLIQEVTKSFNKRVMELEINYKLRRIKKNLLKDKIESSDKQLTIFDTTKYSMNYTRYINTWTHEIKKLYSTKYNNLNQYKHNRTIFEKTMDKYMKKYDINEYEMYNIETKLSQAIRYTEGELNSIESIQKIYNEYSSNITNIERTVDKVINNEEDNHSLNTMVSDIQKYSYDITNKTSGFIHKMSSSILTNMNKICKHDKKE